VRRRLLVVVLAASTLVVVAFAVPLALLVRRVAEDRALDAADGDAAALAPVLALTTELDDLEAALARTGTGADGRLAVWLPDGRTVGAPERLAAPGTTDDLALARSGLSFSRQRGDGVDLWTPVLLAGGEVAVIAAHVPDELQRDGVTTSWVALGGVALALVAGSLVVAPTTFSGPCGEGRIVRYGAAHVSADGSAWERLPFTSSTIALDGSTRGTTASAGLTTDAGIVLVGESDYRAAFWYRPSGE